MNPNAKINKMILEKFAAQFEAQKLPGMAAGALAVHPTEGVNGRRVPDAFMCAYYDPDTAAGVTAIIFGKQYFKAFIEIVRSPQDGLDDACLSSVGDYRPMMAGQTFAKAMAAFKVALHGEATQEVPDSGPTGP